jgi:hypothetical protein
LLGSGCKATKDVAPVTRAEDARAQPEAASPPAALDAAPEESPVAEASTEAGDDLETLTFPDKDPCVATCRKRAAQLKCGREQGCRASCSQLRGAKYCVPQVRAFLACLLKTPRTQWICDEDYQPALAPAACPAERTGMMGCLMKSGGKL